MRALVQAGYLRGVESRSPAELFPQYLALAILERGRRAVGQWPPDAGDAFLIGPNRLIATESDPEERGTLVRFRDTAGEIGKHALTA